MKYLNSLLALFILPFLVGAQSSSEELPVETQSYTLNRTTSKFVVGGTSTLHDWEMVSNECKGSITYTLIGDALSFENVSVNVQVETLKSGKKTMDKKCYDALKYKKFPVIGYEFKSMSDLQSKGGGSYTAVFNGNLTIAGNTKNVPINVTIDASAKTINIKGRKAFKMTDFGVEPPTALLGTIKTGDDITIDFNLNYN